MTEIPVPVAIRYHQATKHSPMSVRTNPHYLDWAIQPTPYKIYPGLEHIPLPTGKSPTGLSAMQILSRPPVEPVEGAIPGLRDVAHLLYHVAGVTKRLVHTHGELHFRAAACAGALYPIETYLVCADMPGLSAGVYHFNPQAFSLVSLRQGDFREVLAEASGGEPHLSKAPLHLVFTAITWRSAWKYQARSYRYHFWDNGTMLANALAVTKALELPARVVLGFADRTVNHLLGLDGVKEKVLSILPLGWVRATLPPSPDPVPSLDLEVEPLSLREVQYPLIDDMHTASDLEHPQQVIAWRQGLGNRPSAPTAFPQNSLPIKPLSPDRWPERTIEETILRRGSTRQFQRLPIPFERFSSLLALSTVGFHGDWRTYEDPFLVDLYLNVHAVDGLDPGAYVYYPREARLERLMDGDFRAESAYLCLGQELGGASGFTVYYLADLFAAIARFGERAYRLVQTEAAILGGNLYLAAYSLGLGATGLTFFDDLMVDFFAPHSKGKDAIFVTACGAPGRPLQRTGRLQHVPPGPVEQPGSFKLSQK